MTNTINTVNKQIAENLATKSPEVIYGNYQVSDKTLRETLRGISEILGADIVLTSGDRHRIVNGNTRSHHLEGRAADFYVEGLSLSQAYEKIRNLPVIENGYQLIHHTTQTKAPHLHLGRYLDNRNSSFIVDNGHILGRR